MANISFTTGNVVFKKGESDVDKALLHKFLRKNSRQEYANLELGQTDVDFDESYCIDTCGRNSFFVSLEYFFNSINDIYQGEKGEDIFTEEEKKRMNGLIMETNYSDVAADKEFIESGDATIMAIYSPEGMKTEVVEDNVYSMDVDAQNADSYLDSPHYDTYTDYGLTRFSEAISETEYMPKEFSNELALKLQNMSVAELKKFFGDLNIYFCSEISEIWYDLLNWEDELLEELELK